MEKAIGGLGEYVPSKLESRMAENIEKLRPDQGGCEGGSTTCPDRTLEKRRSYLAKLAKHFAEDLAKDSLDQQRNFEPMKFPVVREDAPLIVHVKYQKEKEKVEEDEMQDQDEDEDEDEDVDQNHDHEVSQNEIRWIYDDDLKWFYDNLKAVRFIKKLSLAMRYDNCARFVKLTQREIAVGTVRRSGIVFDPGLLLIMAINSKAVLIAKAILDGSAGLGISDLNEGMNPFYPPPAFVAARTFLPDMINELE